MRTALARRADQQDDQTNGFVIQRIEIQALERILLARSSGGDDEEPELVYALAMHVMLDPTHRAAKREPERDVILLLIREYDEWRISQAPKRVRTWLQEHIARPDLATPGDAALPGDEVEPD